MPVIVELRLRAERITRKPYVPTTVQLHGLACALFEGAFSEDHESQAKPFSIWPLTPAPDGWLLRAAWLAPGFPQQVLASCGRLRVGPVFCTVTDLALHPESFTGIAGRPPAGQARLDFRSPTYFTSNRTRVITPDPRLIAGSWRRHWNIHADPGLHIPDEDWRTLTNALRLTAFDLTTERRDTGYGTTGPGFTGTATLALDRQATPETRAQFTALAGYAAFTGTGAQSTHGFGATTTTLVSARPSASAGGGSPATMTPTASA